MDVFGYYEKTPKLGPAFQDTMALFSEYKPSWTKMYDTDALVDRFLGKAANRADGNVLIVDIGGSHGGDLESLRAKYYHRQHVFRQGCLFLQDTVDVLARAKLVNNEAGIIQAMPYVFFTPQPIKGNLPYWQCIAHSVCR